jgi:hypothetical protein
VLGGGDGDRNDHVETAAYEYGRNLGIAFQLVDDVLDVTQSADVMGKETSVDIQLGLATAFVRIFLSLLVVYFCLHWPLAICSLAQRTWGQPTGTRAHVLWWRSCDA